VYYNKAPIKPLLYYTETPKAYHETVLIYDKPELFIKDLDLLQNRVWVIANNRDFNGASYGWVHDCGDYQSADSIVRCFSVPNKTNY
jgi:hypothetical protein